MSRTNLKTAIKMLRNLMIKFESMKLKMNVVNYLGEYMVALKLFDMGLDPTVLPNQSGADIRLGNKKLVEVKTARWSGSLGHWGFGRIQPDKFDYLVCVALDDDFQADYIIFTKKEARGLPSEKEANKGVTTRFKNNTGLSFHLSRPGQEKLETSERTIRINENIGDFRDKWEKFGIR